MVGERNGLVVYRGREVLSVSNNGQSVIKNDQALARWGGVVSRSSNNCMQRTLQMKCLALTKGAVNGILQSRITI